MEYLNNLNKHQIYYNYLERFFDSLDNQQNQIKKGKFQDFFDFCQKIGIKTDELQKQGRLPDIMVVSFELPYKDFKTIIEYFGIKTIELRFFEDDKQGFFIWNDSPKNNSYVFSEEDNDFFNNFIMNWFLKK